jgi:hypothetical protein
MALMAARATTPTSETGNSEGICELAMQNAKVLRASSQLTLGRKAQPRSAWLYPR